MAANASDNNRSKPRKPLSAYNLFYRYKRAKMVEANGTTKEAVHHLVATAAGLETYPSSVGGMFPPARLDQFRRTSIRLALGQDLFSKDTRNRKHRKSTNGFKMSFVEMNRMMVDSWKGADEFTKHVFQELAEDARRMYQQQLIDYSVALHNIARNNSIIIAKKASPRDVLKTETPKLGFAQCQGSSLVITKAKAPVAVPLVKSEAELSWEPLPFTNPDPPTETKPSPRSSTSYVSPKAVHVPSTPHIPVNNNIMYKPKAEEAFYPPKLHDPHTSPLIGKPCCYPAAIVVTPPVSSSEYASISPNFLPPPFLEGTRRKPSSLSPRRTASNLGATPIYAGMGRFHPTNSHEVGGNRSPSPAFFFSNFAVSPPSSSIDGGSDSSRSEEPTTLSVSNYNHVHLDNFALDDFVDLIAILDDDS